MIKTNDILRPTPESSYALQVFAVRGDMVDVYDATSGSVNPKCLSRYDGWVIERNGKVVGTV